MKCVGNHVCLLFGGNMFIIVSSLNYNFSIIVFSSFYVHALHVDNLPWADIYLNHETSRNGFNSYRGVWRSLMREWISTYAARFYARPVFFYVSSRFDVFSDSFLYCSRPVDRFVILCNASYAASHLFHVTLRYDTWELTYCIETL